MYNVDATTKEKVDMGKDLTGAKDGKETILEKLGKASDKISAAMKSRHKACNDSSIELIHDTLNIASASVYHAMRDIKKQGRMQEQGMEMTSMDKD